MTQAQQNLDLEQSWRGNTYGLLATLLASPPSTEVIQQLADLEIEVTEATTLSQKWSDLSVQASNCDMARLVDEYDALFIGIARGEVVPYGSWYLTGFMMNTPLAELRSDLKKLGIQRQEGIHESEDHISALCDVMRMLIIDSLDLQQQAIFFQRHIKSWALQFFQDLQIAESANFYSTLGELGKSFIEIESEYLISLN